ncbi:hypothetical protein JCM24511_01211 [Saitozyma sp. JCM 24511]|nr:hypothetical protein JCM24511_01211 [Saitozyma sp. JCM 24511]
MSSDESKVLFDSQRGMFAGLRSPPNQWSTQISDTSNQPSDQTWDPDGAIPFAVITLEPTLHPFTKAVDVCLGLSDYSTGTNAYLVPSLGCIWDGNGRSKGLAEELRDSVLEMKEAMDAVQRSTEYANRTERNAWQDSSWSTAQILYDTIMKVAPDLEQTVQDFLGNPNANFEMARIENQLEDSQKPINHSTLFRLISLKKSENLANRHGAPDHLTRGSWRVAEDKVETHLVRMPDRSTISIPYVSDCLVTLFDQVKWNSLKQEVEAAHDEQAGSS